jgi:hypothetical protein
MVNERARKSIGGGSLAVACGAALLMVVALVSAATIVQPLPSSLPTGTDVSPADTAGVNLLEPAVKATGSEAKGKLATGEGVERVVSEWTPTGGPSGGGGGGSPKK